MKIYVNVKAAGDLVVEHLGKQLQWRAIKSVEQKEFDIFKELNEYWDYCDAEKQSAIFQAFQNIHNVFAEFLHLGMKFDVQEIVPRLRVPTAKLFEYHKQEDVFNWYRFHSGITVPSGIPAVYDEAEGRPGTRDQTYDRADYERLIVLSVSIRCMIPVWGEFIIRTEDPIGNTRKEYWAMELLRDSNITHCAAMVRLRKYVEAMVNRAPIEYGVILKVMSSHNFLDWMLALTAVRRLTRGDLRTGGSNTNLAAFIYGFLRMKLDGMSNQVGEVKPKTSIASSGDGENNLSELEDFRIKQSITAGDIAIDPEYLRLTMEMVASGNDLPPTSLPVLLNPVKDIRSLIKQAEHQTRYLVPEVQEDPPLLICGYLVNAHISIRSIPYYSKTTVMRLFAICAATLWSYKQRDLACLIMNIYRTPLLAEKMARPADVRQRVNKELAEALKQRFPFQRPGRGGKPIDNGAVFNAIDMIVDMIKDRDIYYNLPRQWATELGITNGTMYHAPANIRNILADFILRLDQQEPGQPLYPLS